MDQKKYSPEYYKKQSKQRDHAKEIFTKLVTSNTFMLDLEEYSELDDEKAAKESIEDSIASGARYALFCAEVFSKTEGKEIKDE
jgi:hypothetical protein